MTAVSWDYFERFKDVNDKYLPVRGEGETIATQAVTAVNKLVYRWYNDGDVFDNTSAHGLKGWVNDLSSYANWLVTYTDKADCLYAIFDIETETEYTQLLKELADTVLDEEWLESVADKEKQGSVYSCKGSFKFEDGFFEEDDEEEYEEYDDPDEY